MSTKKTTQTVESFRASQIIIPQWIQRALSGLALEDLVDVTRESTPFGTYVLAVESAKRQARGAAWNIRRCEECDRIFDLDCSSDADEWAFGHDCEDDGVEWLS